MTSPEEAKKFHDMIERFMADYDGTAIVGREVVMMLHEYYPELKINYIHELSDVKPGINAWIEH